MVRFTYNVLLNSSIELISLHQRSGKTFTWAQKFDLEGAIEAIKYFAGWADKVTGQTIEVGTEDMPYF